MADTPGAPARVRIELGSANDIDRLRPLWLNVHAVHQRSAPGLGPWVSDETTWRKRRALYERCLAHPDSFLLLARREDRLVGYALVTLEPDGAVLWNDSWVVGDKVAELESLSVLPEEQEQGIGTMLLDAADEELERRGIHDLVVGAVPGNSAVDFYERRGFVPNWVILSRFASRRATR
jgi:GNAT superfamily N-acetyltransferase